MEDKAERACQICPSRKVDRRLSTAWLVWPDSTQKAKADFCSDSCRAVFDERLRLGYFVIDAP